MLSLGFFSILFLQNFKEHIVCHTFDLLGIKMSKKQVFFKSCQEMSGKATKSLSPFLQ